MLQITGTVRLELGSAALQAGRRFFTIRSVVFFYRYRSDLDRSHTLARTQAYSLRGQSTYRHLPFTPA